MATQMVKIIPILGLLNVPLPPIHDTWPIGHVFKFTVSVCAILPWFKILLLILLSSLSWLYFEMEIFFSTRFWSFVLSFIVFLVAYKIQLKNKPKQARIKLKKKQNLTYLAEYIVFTIAYFPLIWTVASHLFITSTFVAFLASATWFILLGFVFQQRCDYNFSDKHFFQGFTALTDSVFLLFVIFTFVYFMICQKECDRIYSLSSPTENPFTSPCPPGNKYSPTPGHIPSYNGCGTDGMHLDKEYLPYSDQEQCCNQHDICYDTCTVLDKLNQTLCDLQFEECLHAVCDKRWLSYVECPFSYLKNSNYWNTMCKKFLRLYRDRKCRAAADILHGIVKSVGVKAYENAQKKACTCIPDTEIGRFGWL